MKLIEKYPEIAKDWIVDKNLPLKLKDISYGSNRKVWWNCKKCNHEYQMRVDNRTGKGCDCPICSNNRKIDSLDKTHPNLSKECHSKNVFLPSDYTSGEHDIVWWIGSCGHEWKAHIHNRTKPKNPTGCPYCANKYVDDTNSLESKFPEIAEE